jgi:hypothetical protein
MGSPMVEHPTLKMMMNEVVDYSSCCECGSCVLRLARKQHQRVPVPPGREESFVRPAEFIRRVG